MYTVFRRAIKDQVWVVINGWHLHNLYTNIQFFCCLLSKSKETKIVTVSKRKYFFGAAIGDRVAFQHQCKLENKPANKETIGASLVWRKNGSRTDPGLKNNVLCPKNENLYRLFDPVVDPENIGDNTVDLEDIGGRRTFDNLSGMNKALNKNESNFNLAICAKLAYGDLNINITIEWMEYHRYVPNIYRSTEFSIIYYKHTITSE